MHSRVRCRRSARERGSLVLLRVGGCGGGRQLGQYPPDARWPTPTPTRTQSYIHLCTQMYNPAPLGRERVAPFSPSASDFDPPSRPRPRPQSPPLTPRLATRSLPLVTFCAIHSRLRGHRTSSLLSVRVTRSTRAPIYRSIYHPRSPSLRQFLNYFSNSFYSFSQ